MISTCSRGGNHREGLERVPREKCGIQWHLFADDQLGREEEEELIHEVEQERLEVVSWRGDTRTRDHAHNRSPFSHRPEREQGEQRARTFSFHLALASALDGAEVSHIPKHAHHRLLVGLLQARTPFKRGAGWREGAAHHHPTRESTYKHESERLLDGRDLGRSGESGNWGC